MLSTHPTGITIGAFDGVHIGHQALVHALVRDARAEGLHPWALTFDPLPRQVFNRGSDDALTSLEQRIARLSRLDLEGVVVLPFDDALIHMPAEQFIERLSTNMRVKGFWIGADFRFGQGQRGDVELLQRVGHSLDFAVHVYSQTINWQGSPVRSSRIRAALKAGALDEANGCLGYPYELAGVVAHGDQRGQTLGFPTANLRVDPQILLPANGVYLCSALVNDRAYEAITNVGVRPTFAYTTPTVEAHLLDFSGDLYGQAMRLAFLHRLRPEKKFASIEDLIAQMRADKSEARAWFAAVAQPGTLES